MRKANILKILRNTSVAVGLGAVSLFGGTAHADSYSQRVQAELNNGKDYSAAVAAASRADGALTSPDLAGKAKWAQRALNEGQDYVAAFEGASRRIESKSVFSSEQVAQAQQAREQINEGKDYIAAWEATTTSEQPVHRVQAARVGGSVGVTRIMK